MIEWHADDYGLFPEQSRRILDTIENGACNGISIMPNSPFLDPCMEMLGERDPEGRVRIAVHLNLVEGRALSEPERVPMLADGGGVLRSSFGRLFLLSLLPCRSRLKDQIAAEFAAQIRRCRRYLKSDGLLLDSHTHIHMIPLVFDAMLDAAERENLPIARIRIPAEEWSAYRTRDRRLSGKKPVNYVKTLLLNALAGRNCRKYRRMEWIRRRALFAGVLCSGRMDQDVVEQVVPNLVRLADETGADLELLFHPGGVFEEEDLAALTLKADRLFLSGTDRTAEAEALKSGTAAGYRESAEPAGKKQTGTGELHGKNHQ